MRPDSPVALTARLAAYGLDEAEHAVATAVLCLGGDSAVAPSLAALARQAGVSRRRTRHAKATLIRLGILGCATVPGSVDCLWVANPALWQPPHHLATARAGQLPGPERPGGAGGGRRG